MPASATSRTAPSSVVLGDARSPTEVAMLAAWARVEHPGAPVLDRSDPALAARLAGAGDPLLVPARVAWLPAERDGERPTRAADLMALARPRRPWPALQPWIARRRPGRARVLAGEPARVSDLRRSFEEEDAAQGVDAFSAFVARRALLACERAERAVVGDRYKVPRLVAEQITASARFRDRAQELAQRLGRATDDVVAEAATDLEELAAVQSPMAIDAFRAAMRPLHTRAWTVKVDASRLEQLRELNRRHALIFLPSHRSYADPLVLAEVLHEHDFPRNHVLGGINMAFWPIGPLGKRAGLVFIRRSFGDDQVYKLAIREYFGHLLAKRFNLEWYMEGGRTRTGKLRPPRYGLLHYLVRALEEGYAEDAMLVPVSIVYDQLHEVGAMAAEQGGARKQAEGLRWLADYVRAQRRNVGAARVTFGEPFSLSGALAEAGEGGAQLEKVAFRVLDGINRITPVTATSLVSFALLGVGERALTADQAARVIAPLLDGIEARGIPAPVAEMRRTAELRRVLDALLDAGVASRYDGGTEPVWSIAPGGHHVAAFYRNGALHHLLIRAIVELALLRVASSPAADDPRQAAWDDALKLRDLLKFEFFFASKRRFLEELEAELELLAPDWRERVGSPGDAARLLAESRTLVAHGALRSFVDAQLVVARRLAARDPAQPIERDAFVQECLGVGRQLLLQGRLHGAESVSQELYASALRLAANRELLDPGGEDVAVRRRAFEAEVEDVVERLVRIRELESLRLEEVLDDVAG